MKKYFVTFCSGIYKHSSERIVKEAKEFNVFDYIFCFDKSIYDNDFAKLRVIKESTRGDGYWLWKPYIVLKTLELMEENDVLLYCDAGCKLFPECRERLLTYFKCLEQSHLCTLSFQHNKYKESDWTKGDLVKLFQEFADLNQLIATTFLVKKNNQSVCLVKEWLRLGIVNNHHLIDDSVSLTENSVTFKEHRHDQSIFSLLRRKQGSIILNDEVDETNLLSPIRAFRIKYKGFIIKQHISPELCTSEYITSEYLELLNNLALQCNKLVLFCKLSNYKFAKQLTDSMRTNNVFVHFYMNEITDVYLQTNFQDFVIYELPIVKPTNVKPTKATPASIKQPLDECFDLIHKLYQTKDKNGFKTNVDEYEIHVEKLRRETTHGNKIFYLDEQYHNNISIFGTTLNKKLYYGKLTDIYINEYDIIQGKKFRDYFNLVKFRYTNILFCKPDFFDVFNLYKDTFQNITLISSSSDHPITNELVEHLEVNNKLVKWYGVNMTASSPKCIAIPLGITSFDTKQTGRFIGFSNDVTENHKILADCKSIIEVRKIATKKEKDKLLYLNFDDNTDNERKIIKEMFNGKSWVTIGNMDKSNNGRRKFLEEVNVHKYVLCPRGNGIDTHRIWESLYVGSVPVVKMERGLESFVDLPILFVTDWKLVTEELLLEKEEFFYQTVWNLEKLFFNYWKCMISNIT